MSFPSSSVRLSYEERETGVVQFIRYRTLQRRCICTGTRSTSTSPCNRLIGARAYLD